MTLPPNSSTTYSTAAKTAILGACYDYAITANGQCICDLIHSCEFRDRISCTGPFVFQEDGCETGMFVSEDDSAFLDLIRKIESLADVGLVKVDIIQKRHIKKEELMSHFSFYPQLFSKRQEASVSTLGLSELELERIKKAFKLGYFNIPSRISLSYLASIEGISKSALSESLRKAQYKILRPAMSELEEKRGIRRSAEDDQRMIIKLNIRRHE